MLSLALGFLLWPVGGEESPSEGDAASQLASFELETVRGEQVRPFASTNGTPQVLLFLRTDCPVSNKYAPEIRRLFEAYHSRGIKFWLIHPMASESLDTIRRHATDYNLPGEILRDPRRLLTRFTGVTVTPEAVVLDARLRTVYRGRIDDRFPEAGRQRAEPTQQDLRDAIEAVLAGTPIKHPRIPAIGCAIPADR